MTTFETLFCRRSIRSYTGEGISREQLDRILKAANGSPVGLAQYENVHLTVIRDPALLAKIDGAAAAMMGDPAMHPLYGAPVFIVVSVKKNPRMETVPHANAAILVHSMALAAVDQGIGCCYIWGAIGAINQNPDLLAELGLPEGFTPSGGLVLGQTQETYAQREIPMDRIGRNEIG